MFGIPPLLLEGVKRPFLIVFCIQDEGGNSILAT